MFSFVSLVPSQSSSITVAGVSRVRLNNKSSRILSVPSAESESQQNTLRWFSQHSSFQTLFRGDSKDLMQQALLYTPVVKEELTVQNSCIFPGTYRKTPTIFGIHNSVFLQRSLNSSRINGVISRGFKSRATITRERNFDRNPSMVENFKDLLQEAKAHQEEQQKKRPEKSQEKPSRSNFFATLRDCSIAVLLMVVTVAIVMFFRTTNSFSTTAVSPVNIYVSFEDVKGIDTAKQELQDVVEFLRQPERFSALGGKLPKGVLLVGPPGTGKTLLAKAVAGEAGVPFFNVPGSQFDEMFVGQGARRVRDLFKKARSQAPCVIFIDEIDSVGSHRTSSEHHPYANQTLNQLLAEMDGFFPSEGIIVIGATNRHEDLDKALLRPGRFDVSVRVDVPDIGGRRDLLEFYLSKIKRGNDIDEEYLARGTIGFTGADIENMVNQAAIKAAVDGKSEVTMTDLEFARDKVIMGPEQKSRIPDKELNLMVAYHEGGHALVSHFTKNSKPLHKITIVPRGQSLGHTAFLPENDRKLVKKCQMMADLDALMGGRAAEELVFGADNVTAGACSDFDVATNLAKRMVQEFGLSEKVGHRTFRSARERIADSTNDAIDQEIKRILQESMERAKSILKTHEKELRLLADALMQYETLDANELRSLLESGSISILGKKDSK